MSIKSEISISTLASRIREARGRANLNQADVATALGKGVATISDWENDRSQPALEDIEKLAHVLKVKPEYLAFNCRVVGAEESNVAMSNSTAQIKELMHVLGNIGQDEMAKRLGIRREYVSRILNGTVPSKQLQVSIAAMLAIQRGANSNNVVAPVQFLAVAPAPILRPGDYGLMSAIQNLEIQIGSIEAYNRLVHAATSLRAKIEKGGAVEPVSGAAKPFGG